MMSRYYKDKKGRRTNAEPKHDKIVPTWFLFFFPTFMIMLGFVSEHYNNSRSIDPLRKKSRSVHVSKYHSRKLGKSLLTPEEDDALELHDGKRLHLVFSTDCSPYQHWQSYLVYYTAMKVKQPGHVTRIVSGCEDDEANKMKVWFDDNIQHMSERFHLHFTPNFSQVVDADGKVVGDYKFFNKPYGLKHFLENFELLKFKDGSFEHDDDIVILIDPDMALTRPLTGDFPNDRGTIIAGFRDGANKLSDKVQPGIPFAQTYGLGVQWETFDLDKIAGPDSPAKAVNKGDGNKYFSLGPPILGTLNDMHKIASKWSEFVPRVHAQYPLLLAEMYAYCIAAAHLNLRHQLINSLMVSDPASGGEGWPLVDAIPAEETCGFVSGSDHSKYPLPSVLHLCQRYSVGEEWFFGKRKIPHNIFECETALFIEPPSNVATLYDFKKPPNAKKRTPLKPKIVNQHAFMVCFLTSLLNEAATFYKKNACTADTANFGRERTVADLFKKDVK